MANAAGALAAADGVALHIHVAVLDDYVIEHFRLAFGNRIVKQLRDFVPAYVGCGGTEIDGLDYVLARKVFRKFESLNLSYIRDEIAKWENR